MKIMYLLFSFTVGGTERLVADVCNEMIKQQNEVYLYIVNDLYSEDVLSTLDIGVHVELQKRNIGGSDKFKTLHRISKYVKDNQIDVIHCNSFYAPELLLLKPIFFRKTKIVHTIHDVGQYRNLKKWKIALRNILCDKFVAISDSVKNDIIQYGASLNKVVTVHNAVNMSRFHYVEKNYFDENRIIIGNVARMMPEKKGQDILVNAIAIVKKEFPGIMCYFAGGYDQIHESSYLELKNSISKLNIENNVVLLGNVNDIPDFLCQIDIFVLPSRFEGFGISLIEAMAMGIPCIASNLDGPAEIIGKDEHGCLFPSEDVHALANKIVYTIKNYHNSKKQAIKDIEYVYEKFDIENMCNRLIQIYMS